MKTVINIKADKEVKERAQGVAKELGLPLSVIINAYLKQFIRRKEVHFYVEGELKPAIKRRLTHLGREAKKGKNISPAFSHVEDAISYLNF